MEQQIEKHADERQELEALALKQEKLLKRYEKKYQVIKSGALVKMKDRARNGNATDESGVGDERDPG